MDRLCGKESMFVEVSAIATEAKLHPVATQRLLRFLSTFGVCIEGDNSTFKLGDLGQLVTSSNPKSSAGRVVLEASFTHAKAWSKLPEFLATNAHVTKSAFGTESYWEMAKQDSGHLEVFIKAMASYSGEEASFLSTEQLSPSFNLSNHNTVCDLGGSDGALSKALAKRFPDQTYILADLPEVIDTLDPSTLPKNFATEAVNFLETVPMADAYLLKHIIHDWDDKECIQIFSNIKETNPSATVYIMEFGPMPPPNVPHLAKAFDVHMGVCLSGHERTQEEYDCLFTRSGYKRVAIHLLGDGHYPLYVQEIQPEGEVVVPAS
uniref:O-methyltransferase C-terminal domain-containing protein n=1 Tax=Heterosigma akashiwo TaxID=2829 RepID=A0A7S4D886_HETAK